MNVYEQQAMDAESKRETARLESMRRVAELEAAMDEASDTAGKLHQMVGRLEPRLGGDGRKCVEIMDMLVALSTQLDTASNRKARHDTQD